MRNRPSLSPLSFLLCVCTFSLALAQKDGKNDILPQATFNSDNKTWNVIVPEVWNYTTILSATGNASMITDPSGTLDNLTLPFPGFTYTASTFDDGISSRWAPLIYVNGTYSRYATNAVNYGMQADLNTSVAAYSDETWTLPVTCEWPISGQYSRLNRVMYYVLLVFALVVHQHEWLVAGALASATIYSGSAAVQAVVCPFPSHFHLSIFVSKKDHPKREVKEREVTKSTRTYRHNSLSSTTALRTTTPATMITKPSSASSQQVCSWPSPSSTGRAPCDGSKRDPSSFTGRSSSLSATCSSSLDRRKRNTAMAGTVRTAA
jgi:hypothetical protein